MAKNAENIKPDDLMAILEASIAKKTLIGHHIDSFNSFLTEGLKQIITQGFKIEDTIINERTQTPEDSEIESIYYLAQFTDARITNPVLNLYTSGKQEPLYPYQARENHLNYSVSVFIDAKLTATAYLKNSNETRVKQPEYITNFKISNLPVMVGSVNCNLGDFKQTPKKTRKDFFQEDPQDAGGYFILEGIEWCVSMIETRLYNHPHIFRNVGHEKEIARLEFISKPGDAFENSSEIIIRYVQNGNIYVTFTSQEYLNSDIPFYIIFRLLGMTIDKEIVDNIVYGYGDNISDHMCSVIREAMTTPDTNFGGARDIIDQRKLLEYFARQTLAIHQYKAGSASSYEDEKGRVYVITNVLKWLDKFLFPHVGLGPSSRNLKLRYLGRMIHKLLLVEYRVVESTDRDSLEGKRINAAGRSYAKSFKRDFNTFIVQPIRKRLKSDFNKTPFKEVQMAHSFKSAVTPVDLEKAMNQSIKSGNKEITIKNRQLPNRMASEMLNRKNQLNTIGTERVIRTASTSASKQDQRADEMRRVQPSYISSICPISSSDTGETVGMVKQLAISAFVNESGSSKLLKKILIEDPDLIQIDRTFPLDIYSRMLACVYVNGDWIGCTSVPEILVTRYRESRRGIKFVAFDKPTVALARGPGIDPYTTIVWKTNTNEIYFWIDAGKITRPILIVRNNGELDPKGREIFGDKYDPFKNRGFRQDLVLTPKILGEVMRGERGIDDLQTGGIIDYVAPEELDNCLVCPDIRKLCMSAGNPLLQYTHCEIPQAVLGLPALALPFGQYIQLPRLTIAANQIKQTNGIYALNWALRCDKAGRVQWYTESPLVRTMANKYLYPNGANVLNAIMCLEGYNQEDSMIDNIAGAQRGAFKMHNSGFILGKKEKDEVFGSPDREYTIDLKMHANYSHLKNGLPPKGTLLRKNDIVIGKYTKIPESEEKFRDTSIIYPHNEDSYVSNDPKILRDEKGDEFVSVKYNSTREVNLGQKFSTRSGQKGENGMSLNHSDMPFTSSGLVPFLLPNPHCIPSRMTVSQLREGQYATLLAIEGKIGDATTFRQIDLEEIGDRLERYGFNRYCNVRMFNGETGEWFDNEIYMAPTYFMRLQKFAEEEVYAISTGPTCAITRQPLEGKANKGGLRIGEMEKDVIITHGASRFLMEKLRDDSDPFDIYICRTCGKTPIVNEIKGLYKCNNCNHMGLTPDIVKIPSTWSSKLFFQELESMNVGVAFEVEPFTYQNQV